MAKIAWDAVGSRTYETGIDHGVLYPYDASAEDKTKAYGPGVPWNGLSGVNETHEGGEPEDIWADNIKYLSIMSTESLNISITAYTYPEEFEECDGNASLASGNNAGISIGQQTRKRFGLCYRTLKGNDESGTDYGYKLHLIYGCLAAPSDRDYSTVNDSPEAAEFSWDVNTTPVSVPNGLKPTASVVIDSTKVTSGFLAALEKALYGDTDTTPYLPLPAEIASMATANSSGT